MMSIRTFKGFVDGARDAYLHAVKRHPDYTTRLNHHTLGEVREFLAECRKYNGKDGGDFNSILEEEMAEYIEAQMTGDTEAAKRELCDCAAVLMREWERISK